MSGFHTHMLIGGVGGLMAFKIAEAVAPSAVTVQLGDYTVPSTVIGLGCVAISAYLALWPDIDEPGSHISHRALRYMWAFGATVALVFLLAASLPFEDVLFGTLCGAVIGWFAGRPFLYMLRVISGGHRRLTHSVLVGGTLMIAAIIMYILGVNSLALPAFAIAWGQFMHLIGDVVTPGGVPLFYPLWRSNIHLFPYAFTRFGEPLIAVTAILIGIIFILI